MQKSSLIALFFAVVDGLLNNPALFTLFAIRCYLRRGRNLISISNVCEAGPISLFRAPNGLNEIPEMRFEIAFILIGKLTVVL